jgi:hypothetical protein
MEKIQVPILILGLLMAAMIVKAQAPAETK